VRASQAFVVCGVCGRTELLVRREEGGGEVLEDPVGQCWCADEGAKVRF
jgi:hypothetical protein